MAGAAHNKNAVIGGLTACALGLSFLFYSHSSDPKRVQSAVTPVVTNVGEKYTPSLSPDGQHLAFAWNGGAGPHFSLYVKLVGTEESIRLTKQASIDFNPVWSPDGRYIAFCRILKGGTGIYIIPALGGAERRVRKTLWEEQEFYQVFWSAAASRGRLMGSYSRILTVHRLNEACFYFSTIARFAGSSQTHFAASVREGDFNPAFSPDGQTLAFARDSQGVSQSTQCRFPEERNSVLSRISHTSGVWRGLLTVATSFSQRLVGSQMLVGFGRYPFGGASQNDCSSVKKESSLRFRGNRLVYVHARSRISTSGGGGFNSLVSAGPPDRFISSTRMESGPQFSPDGSKIAFESTRSGAYEIWMCRSDGSGLIQLTQFNSSDWNSTLVARRTTDCFRFSLCRECRHFRHRFSGRLASQADQRTIERSRAKLVARRPLDIFRVRSHGRLGSMENAFDRWIRRASDTPWWICSLRIARRKIPVLCKRPDRSWTVAHSD